MSAEIRAYSGNPDVRVPALFPFLSIYIKRGSAGWLATTKARTLALLDERAKNLTAIILVHTRSPEQTINH
jgi:hypothetical protein